MNKNFWSILLVIFIIGCTSQSPAPNLIPDHVSSSPNYWCTWYWQNYLILVGQEVVNPDPATVYSNSAARDELNEETVFGEQGMAKIMLPQMRSDYYFLIDHGWQDKSIKENTFFTLIMDTLDFPRYANLEPKDRIKQMNLDIKDLGWKGLGLWMRGSPSEENMRKYIEWSKYAGIEYWKIDGGDTKEFFASKIKNDIYPELTLEHVTGAGPLTPLWNQTGLLSYSSSYNPVLNPQKSEKALDVLKNTDVFRTYDAAPLLVSTTTLQRIHDLLSQTAGHDEYSAFLNIQDDCNIAAALGLVVAVKRHPMKTPRMYEGKDYHLQIAGDRHVDRRLNEMDRLVRWQRIAEPMPAGYGTYKYSERHLIDSIRFSKSDTWFKPTHGNMVRQSAPAIMTRNISLPEVKSNGMEPYVMASKFPNGSVAISTEGRVTPNESWTHPKADITLSEIEIDKAIGVFGFYNSLTLVFDTEFPKGIVVYGQDLMANIAQNISDKVKIERDRIIIPGDLIEMLGTSEGDKNDISAPGLVVKVISN